MSRVLVSAVAVVALCAISFTSQADDTLGVDITVAPNVINVAAASTLVTVHTDIAYSLVDGASVTLNGIEIDWWKSDDRGYFVAKFVAAEVKAIDGIEQMDTIELTLQGVTVNGRLFCGSDAVDVIDVKAKRQ